MGTFICICTLSAVIYCLVELYGENLALDKLEKREPCRHLFRSQKHPRALRHHLILTFINPQSTHCASLVYIMSSCCRKCDFEPHCIDVCVITILLFQLVRGLVKCRLVIASPDSVNKPNCDSEVWTSSFSCFLFSWKT